MKATTDGWVIDLLERLFFTIDHFEMRNMQFAEFLADNFGQRVHFCLVDVRYKDPVCPQPPCRR